MSVESLTEPTSVSKEYAECVSIIEQSVRSSKKDQLQFAQHQQVKFLSERDYFSDQRDQRRAVERSISYSYLTNGNSTAPFIIYKDERGNLGYAMFAQLEGIVVKLDAWRLMRSFIYKRPITEHGKTMAIKALKPVVKRLSMIQQSE